MNDTTRPVQSEFDLVLGHSVRRHRELNQMSQSDLSAQMQVRGFGNWGQPTVARVESGIRALKYEEALTLQEIFKTEALIVDEFKIQARAAAREIRRYGISLMASAIGLSGAQERLRSILSEQGLELSELHLDPVVEFMAGSRVDQIVDVAVEPNLRDIDPEFFHLLASQMVLNGEVAPESAED